MEKTKAVEEKVGRTMHKVKSEKIILAVGKLKENGRKKERRRGINSIFFGAPCIPHPPCGPRAGAHVSTAVRICFYYYTIGCGENIGKLYLCVHWEGAGK